jgi:GDP-D-mannose dehydratase
MGTHALITGFTSQDEGYYLSNLLLDADYYPNESKILPRHQSLDK